MTFDPMIPNGSAPTSQQTGQQPQAVPLAAAKDADSVCRQAALIVVAMVCFLLATLVAAAAFGQGAGAGNAGPGNAGPGNYKVIERANAFNDPKNLKAMKSEIKKLTTQGEGNQGFINAYYARYIPAVFTAPGNGAEITEVSRDIRAFITRAARSRARNNGAYQKIVNMTKGAMEIVIGGNHHPAGRTVATTILGQLNREPLNTARKQPPQPLLEVFPRLLALYSDENETEGVRAAALHGLDRQVRFAFPQIARAGEFRTRLQKQMMDLLKSQPPAGRSAEAHAFLQRYAVNILSKLRDPADKSLGVELVSISTNNEAPDLIAFYSASEIGTMADELQGSVPDVDKVIANWSARFYVALENEIDRVKLLLAPRTPASGQPAAPSTYLESNDTRNAGDFGGRDFGGGGTFFSGDRGRFAGGFPDSDFGNAFGDGLTAESPVAPQPPIVRRSRSKVNSVAQKIHRGVTGADRFGLPQQPRGLYAAANANQQQQISTWVTKLQEVMEEINDPTIATDDEYVTRMEEQLDVIRKLAGKVALDQARGSGTRGGGGGGGSGTRDADGAAPVASPIDEAEDPLAAAEG